MNTALPLNLDDLLHGRTVESERVEFKRSWDPATIGPQVLRTICAFANDHHNLNGGYIVVGVEERGSRAVLPPNGLAPEAAEAAGKWIRGNCKRLDPDYQPILFSEWIEDRLILVVWAPASDVRPHRAPEGKGGWRYWVRIGTETVDAEHGGLLQALIQQAAGVPWDDRRASDAHVGDMREARVREFLHKVNSGLLDQPDTNMIYRGMRLTTKVNDHEVPRNVGLLLFSAEPTEWFRGAKIEVVHFASDRGGDVQEERVFTGGLLDQYRDCMGYLNNLLVNHLQKQEHRSRARSWASYPAAAIREALVNALYHRSYDLPYPEPTKVYVFPDRMEIISYPGPVPGVQREHLAREAVVRGVPARNRRIGEFFKELREAEQRLSGLPKMYRAMEANGSPPPKFDFDEGRTFFQVTLRAHTEYVALSGLRDTAHLSALGDREEALRRLQSAWRENVASGVLAAAMIRECAKRGKSLQAVMVFRMFESTNPPAPTIVPVANALAEAMVADGDLEYARRLLRHTDAAPVGQDAIDAAILARQAWDPQLAHRYFDLADEAVYGDSRALLEFARTKIDIAMTVQWDRSLLVEARSLLERVLQLDASRARKAWTWREMARTLNGLRAPRTEIGAAYRKAIALLPSEDRFRQELDQLENLEP